MDQFSIKLFERIPTLTENNWPIWKWKVELALQHLEMWPLTNDSTSQSNDLKIRSLIGLWVDDSLIPLIRNCETAYTMWKALTEHFEDEPKPIHVSLSLFMKEDGSRRLCPNNTDEKQQQQQKRLKCDFCQHEGHIESKCWRKKRNSQKNDRIVL